MRTATDLEEGRHAFLVQVDCTSRDGGKPLCKPVRILLTAEVDTLKAVLHPIGFRLRGEPDGSRSLYLGSFYEATGPETRKFSVQNACGIPLQARSAPNPSQIPPQDSFTNLPRDTGNGFLRYTSTSRLRTARVASTSHHP